jgi:hypothetical protein
MNDAELKRLAFAFLDRRAAATRLALDLQDAEANAIRARDELHNALATTDYDGLTVRWADHTLTITRHSGDQLATHDVRVIA